MRNLFLILTAITILVAAYSCRKPGEQPQEYKIATTMLQDTAVVEFSDSMVFEFDTINEGDVVKHTFKIKNVGSANFIIADARGSCGCTVPTYSKEPLKSGDTYNLDVEFNSANKQGEQTKTVTLFCNTAKRNETLYLKGYVIPKNKQENK